MSQLSRKYEKTGQGFAYKGMECILLMYMVHLSFPAERS